MTEFDYDKFEDLVVNVSEGVATFRINRPERLNAFGPQTWWEVIELAHMLQADDAVRVVVGTGDDRAFSSGADVRAGRDADEPPRPVPTRADRLSSMGVTEIGVAMPEIDKPTIAAVNGVCAGAGMGFACSFDIRILGPNARFTPVFVRRALTPDCGLTWFLPRLVGPAMANELFFTGRDVQAEEAVQIGLGNRLVDDPVAEAMEMAAQLAKSPPISMLWAKREVQATFNRTLREQVQAEWIAQKQASSSKDVQEGFKAFLEKREPTFTGE